jgi:hypothetical protein
VSRATPRPNRRAEPSARPRSVPFAALVLFVALWPLVHRGVVATWHVDPWKLGGFAMYTTWQSTVVALFRPEAGGLRLVAEDDLSVPARDALARFRARRSALGRLASPDDAMRLVQAGRPDLAHVVVVVQRLWLDRETGLVASEKEILPYVRGEPLAAGPP